MKLFSTPFLAVLVVLLVAPLAFAANSSNATVNTTGLNSTNTTIIIIASPTPEPKGNLLDLEVSYFLEPSETSATSNFTSGGSTYYLVKVAGKGQLVFDSNYKPVSDEAQIRALVAAYVKSLPVPFKKSDLQSLESEFSSVNSSWDYCRQVWWEFISGKRICIEQTTRKLQCWIIYDGDYGASFGIPPATAENRRNIGNGTYKTNNATIEAGALLASVDAEFDSLGAEDIKARMGSLKDATAKIRAGYTQFNSAHQKYLTYYPFATDGGINRCAFNEKALANMEKLVDVTALFSNTDAISNETAAGSKARLDRGTVRKLAASTEKELSGFELKYKKAKADFDTANKLEPTAITAAFIELTSISLAVKNASTYAAAKSKSDEFETKLRAGELLVAQSQDALVPYVDGLRKLNNASNTLEAASKVYGQNDPRLIDLKTQLSTLRSSFELKEGDLKHGRPVTVTDFQGIANTAANLTATANSLPRRENEIDWVLVVGLVMLVALIAGAIWYLRKYKKEQQGL